ncbi:hypothetical protein HY572_02170 [Candidatus Micrarchaeota archaeon]|nr:hypothetical protein [Candidatus Micrarchaeota archaeon]
MASLDALVSALWPLFLISVMVGVPAFVLVFAFSFVYAYLVKRFEGVPKIFWMLFCTVLGTFVALVLLYVYLDVTLGQFLDSVAP